MPCLSLCSEYRALYQRSQIYPSSNPSPEEITQFESDLNTFSSSIPRQPSQNELQMANVFRKGVAHFQGTLSRLRLNREVNPQVEVGSPAPEIQSIESRVEGSGAALEIQPIESRVEVGSATLEIQAIENDFHSLVFSFPTEQEWREKIQAFRGRLLEIRPRVSEEQIRVLEQKFSDFPTFERAGVGIEDRHYVSPFVQFFHRCQRPNLNTEQVIRAFQQMPLDEQWQICNKAKEILGIHKDYEQPHEFLMHERCPFSAFNQVLELFLKDKVNNLPEPEKGVLFGLIRSMAKNDGGVLPNWDADWGEYHAFDHRPRLLKALSALEQKKIADTLRNVYIGLCQGGFGQEIAHRLIQNCPLLLPFKQGHPVDNIYIRLLQESGQEVARRFIQNSPLLLQFEQGHPVDIDLNELRLRAEKLQCLQTQKNQLQSKYPQLNLHNPGSEGEYNKGWRDQETFFLMFPTNLGEKEQARFDYFSEVVQELIDGDYDLVSAQLILDRLLTRESFHSFSSDIPAQVRLHEIQEIAQRQLCESSLNLAVERYTKDIFVIPSSDDKQGKFKPLGPCARAQEAYGYNCDRLLGIGMTAPTMMFNSLSQEQRAFAKQSLNTIERLFGDAFSLTQQGLEEQADEKRSEAFSKLWENEFSSVIRNALFKETYRLHGEGRNIDRLGEKLFCNRDSYGISDSQREELIRNCKNSRAFDQLIETLKYQGSIQTWLNHCGKNAFEYIVRDVAGGAKLKTAPKVLAHFYALLGIIKGSTDGFPGNTFVQFDEFADCITHFWDIDDERSMPLENNFWHMHFWQIGLPQCAKAFDRAFLLLFTEPGLLEKLQRIQTPPRLLKRPRWIQNLPNIDDQAYDAQTRRLEMVMSLFRDELQKTTITLTPRELFFRMFPGSEEHFFTTKQRFNNDKRNGEEGIRIAPIEIFEFHLPEAHRNLWYTGDEQETRQVGINMRALYDPELP